MIEVLASTGVLVAWVALLGLLVGSFLNVVILRLPARLMHAWREQAVELLEEPGPHVDAATPALGTRATAAPRESALPHAASAPDAAEIPHVAELLPAADSLQGADALQGADTLQGTDAPHPADAPDAPDAADPPPPGIVHESSHCPRCKHRLAPWENVPLLSFVLLRGRCRHCGAAISWQYPAVEAITALLFALCALEFGFGWPLLAALALTGILVAASGIDLRTQLLPDELTLPLLWLGLLCAVPAWFVSTGAAILGAAAGYLVLWSVYWAFKLATGKDGMGYGDFKLLAGIGAFVGYAGIIPVLLVSSIAGAVVGSAWLLVRGKDRATPIPFGQFLALAGWIQFVYGDAVLGLWRTWLVA